MVDLIHQRTALKWILKIKHLRQTKDSKMFEISFNVMLKMWLFSVFWSSVKSGQNTKNLSSAPLIPGTFFCHYLHFCSVNFSPKLLLPRASYHASNQANGSGNQNGLQWRKQIFLLFLFGRQRSLEGSFLSRPSCRC